MKGYWDRFKIPFKGLKDKIHSFDFKIDERFFDAIEHSLLDDGAVNVHLEMNKKPNMLILTFYIQGSIKLQCDRCLEIYDQPVEGKQTLFVKFSEHEKEISDGIIYLPWEAFELDVGLYIYEFINLFLPMRHVHPEGQCNPEMIRKLNEEENNHQDEEEIDERWKALEKLKKNMNDN